MDRDNTLNRTERLAYGAGGAVHSVKDATYAHFVPFFYAQVLALSPGLYGLAAMIGQLFDAVTDPLVGSLSDRTRSRWGRRHPWMLASAVPLGLCFLLLFRPPEGLSQVMLCGWLITTSVAIRGALTMFYVPLAALGAEASHDYDQRTRIVSYRTTALWLATLLIPWAAYTFVFGNSSAVDGRLVEPNYRVFSWWAAGLVVVLVLVSTLGTRSLIPKLPQRGDTERFRVLDPFRDVAEALRNRNFRWIFAALLVLGGTTGVTSLLAPFALAYYWEFSTATVGQLTLFSVVPTIVGFFIVRPIGRRVEKMPLCVVAIAVISLNALWWYGGRLLGWLPENGSMALLVLAYVHQFVLIMPAVVEQSVFPSMIADIADEHEVETGVRKDGTFQAATAFAVKAPLGLGQGLGGLLLAWIGIGAGTLPGEASSEALLRLGLSAGPIAVVLYLLALLLFLPYRLSRARHLQLQNLLASRRSLP